MGRSHTIGTSLLTTWLCTLSLAQFGCQFLVSQLANDLSIASSSCIDPINKFGDALTSMPITLERADGERSSYSSFVLMDHKSPDRSDLGV